MAHVQDRCEQCGQIDDHPKSHISRDGVIRTYHHDCLSWADEQMVRDSAQAQGAGPKASAIIDACKGGTRGDKLRQLIDSGELPQAEGLHHAQQLEAEGVDR